MADLPKSERVAQEARTWIGTPWHHAADIKGRGVDCAMLLVRCFVDTGILAPFDPRPYPMDWYLHRDEDRFLEWMDRFGDRLPAGELEIPGDVRLYSFGRCTSHAGIVIEPGYMVHADRGAGKVCRCETERWAERYVATYRVRA